MINVTDSGYGKSVVDFDGEGVYVAVLDTGLVPNWRDYFPEERIDANLATAFTEVPMSEALGMIAEGRLKPIDVGRRTPRVTEPTSPAPSLATIYF
jgi:hypothetical protein